MELNVKIKGRSYVISGPMDLEGFWEELSNKDELSDDKIPYWCELWPSSLLLGKFILTNPHLFRHKTCLDLGCGLGLLSIILKFCGARLISQDLSYRSLIFCKKNFQKNRIESSLCIQGDWREVCYKENSLDIIVASDILYEKRFHEPILNFILKTLNRKGIFYICTPKRHRTFDFFDTAKKKGVHCTLIKKSTIPLKNQKSNIYLWKLKLI